VCAAPVPGFEVPIFEGHVVEFTGAACPYRSHSVQAGCPQPLHCRAESQQLLMTHWSAACFTSQDARTMHIICQNLLCMMCEAGRTGDDN
jgi:hypothetical protein